MKQGRRKSRRSDSRAGFVLIEVLAALAVTGVVLAIAAPFFGRLITRWSTGQASAQRQDQWMQAIPHLSEDLGQALPLSLGGGRLRLAFHATPKLIIFVRETLEDRGKTKLETVRWTIERSAAGDRLLRSSSPFEPDLFEAEPDQGRTTPLLAGDFHLRFSVVDADGQSGAEWLSGAALPQCVDLAIQPLSGDAGRGSVALPLCARDNPLDLRGLEPQGLSLKRPLTPMPSPE